MKKRENYPFGADQMMQINLDSFLITLIRDFPESHDAPVPRSVSAGKISDIYDYISEHYTEKLTLHDLCFIFGTNKTTLTKDFRRLTGDTVMGHLARLRLRRAKALLREGKCSVTEIAELLNFSSVHYFTRFFRKHENMTPSEYAVSIRARFEE